MSSHEQGKLVSIIIPVFNCEKYIRSCVESCIKQTYKNVEIIIIDDGSTDSSRECIADYISSGEVKYYFQENRERSTARNNGLDKAQGDYIQFLDADDEIYPNKIETQVNFLLANDDFFAVRCQSAYKNIYGNITHYADAPHNGLITKKLIKGNFIPIHTMLFRKTDVRFDVSKRLQEDWKYWLFATFNKKVGYISNVLCSVTIHDSNSSKSDITMRKSELLVIKEMMANSKFRQYYLLLLMLYIKKQLILLKLNVKLFVFNS
ncbi:glycosyltransferase family 2 protein [Paraglaciecola aestuariivivens]